MMEPFHYAVAAGPLAIYFLSIGFLRTRSQPLVTTGGRDIGAIAMGLVGMMAVGPMELFFPRYASAFLGGWVWVLLLLFYVLCVLLVILMGRPRLVVYGLSVESLREVSVEVANELDDQSQLLGDALLMPKLGVQATLEETGGIGVSQIVASGNHQRFEGWLTLERTLSQRIKKYRSTAPAVGYMMLCGGILLVATSMAALLWDPTQTLDSFRAMLRW